MNSVYYWAQVADWVRFIIGIFLICHVISVVLSVYPSVEDKRDTNKRVKNSILFIILYLVLLAFIPSKDTIINAELHMIEKTKEKTNDQ